MFVLNPDPYSLPAYRIGPFRTADVVLNRSFPLNNGIDDYFDERFRGLQYMYTYNGRSAINISLTHFGLAKNDVVTILTTSGNFYISSCVTGEIEKFCRWSREILPETKVILVNHEFGYPFQELNKLKELGLPIIEDCAGSFFSEDPAGTIGRTGDFTIYSFPKMFPLQIGGLLVGEGLDGDHESEGLTPGLLRYIKNILSRYITLKEEIIGRRLENYKDLRSRFEKLGLPERFELTRGIVPGVFMFRTDQYDIDLPAMKQHFWSHGIQSSVFYGEDAFFIPVHQALEEGDLDYFFEVMRSFLKRV